MSGCGCGSPVVLSAPAAARMDVEGSLLCDVLADGTVAAQALVEAVYDTSTGLRVGTRTVNPVTGADYLVQGTLQPCPPPEQCSCETVLLCDQPLGGDEVIQGLDVSGGTLANGVAWQVTGSQNAPDVSDRATEDGAWWRTAIFPNQPVGPTTWTFNRSAAVEFSVFLMWTAYEDTVGGNRAKLPPGAEPISLPPGYSYDPATSIVSVDDTRAGDCAGLTNPTEGVSARFRLAGPVESFTLLYLGERSTASPCAEFGTWFFGAVHVDPVPVPFLRHICRTCTGTATVTDTTLDGVTTYDTSTATVGVCGPTSSTGGLQVVERCGCDDVNGDGTLINRYVELWSVDPGGQEDPALLGSWLDGDFTQPYTPANPVDCPTDDGAPAAPLVLGQVCYDDGTSVRPAAVVRCAGCDDPAVRYVDVETGAEVTAPTLVPCPADPGCASPTTPVTSVGLCLADGTPIAVTVVRDCTGTITSEGWLNLTSGAWTAGTVPVGTVACGDSRSIQVSGTFCALEDATGDVVGLVLVEYTYDDTGAIASVRLVDAVTGDTYTPPAGVTVTTCPTGTAQPEQDAVVLCHTATDGTVTQFVRDYRRDETGAITAHSDYLLDGTAYTPDPTGTVGVCQPDSCTDCETLLLCDVPTAAPVRITGTAASGTLSNGVSWTSTSPSNATYAPQRNNADGSWWGLPSFPLATTTPTKWTFSRPSFVEFSVYVAYSATQPALNHAQLPAGLEPVSLPTGYAYDPATGVLTRTSDGSPADPCSYTTDPQVIGSARFRTSSAVTTFTTAPAPNSRVARCGIFFTYWAGAVSVVPGGPFLRHLCRSCDGTPTVTDTLLDGITPYLPAGTVDQCQTGVSSSTDPETCHNTTTVLLCDAPTDGVTAVAPTITDSTVAAVGQTQFQNHPGPYGPLWSGGTLIYPAGPGPAQEHLAATGRLTADLTGCEEATANLTISVRVRNDGPDTGQDWDGALRLFRGTTQIAAHNALAWAPVGWQGTLTVTAPVTPAEITAGDIRVALMLETYHLGAKSWTACQFTATLELEGCTDAVPVQFLRNIVTDCETGTVVTHYDSTLDGAPYDVGGVAVQCQPATTEPEPAACCPTSETVSLCHTAVDGTVTEFVRDYHRDATGIITGYNDYTLDGADYVPDPTGTVGQCRPVDCTSTPLCVRPSGVVEFISNAENRTTGDVDPVWKWSSMSLAGPWYDMYQVGVFPGWTVTDPGTPGGTAHWVSQHPNSSTVSTGLPNEGPDLTAANPDWYARASFELPAFADPATIQVESTVLNADQMAVEWRLNEGPWQPVGADHNDAAYTFGPAAVPGAQAGTNTIYLHGQETVFGSGATGVMMHLVVTYDVDASAFEQWLRTTCSDGSITYLDGDGNPQPGIPEDSTIVPCPGGTGGDAGFDVESWPLCILDSTGAVVQRVRAEQVYDTAGVATGAPRLVDAVTGDPATIPAGGSVSVCPDSTTASLTPVCYTAPTVPPVTCDTVTLTELTAPDITDAVVVENPQGWGVRPESTYNGDTSAAGGPDTGLGVINCNDFQGDTGVVIDYTITPPASNVTGVNLWNAFGNSLIDRDGIGSATLTLLDSDGNTLWTGPLNACRPTSNNYDLACLTDLGGQVDGVAIMRLSNIAKVPPSEGSVNVDIGWREIGLVTAGYEALLTLDCGGQEVTATVEGAADGLAYAGGQLTQTAGPHTLTWHAPAGYAGTIITDTPTAFDRLDFADGTVVTLSGNGTVTFAVEIGAAGGDGGTSAGFVTVDPVTGLPTVRDANTGQVVTGAVIVPCTGDCCDDGGTTASGRQLVERCGCDDLDGDGIGEVRYVELWSVDPEGVGAPLLVGTYEDGDFEAPYAPANPIDCPAAEDEPAARFSVTRTRMCVRDIFNDQSPRGYAYRVNVYDATTGDFVSSRLETADGTPFTPPVTQAVVECEGEAADTNVRTGAERFTDNTTPYSPTDAFPGLQSVTLVVLAGDVQVNSGSGPALVPAGVSLTWSVADVDDAVIAPNGISFTGQPGSDYIVSFTHKDTLDG
ncbi:hypothetical protein VSR01_17120 [Actinacidiphila sp. DG2A-62]|uniref:hypothetical protein n=1 Tax=Actinacidiphila sp. DG2A-62 TaxID=3108821 RepID=UPI002DBA4B0F|nr:hypothetical protein [Actinacidiphila sp. DG2A-62]MEC3995160.1 hypothetical protein [Actinacidiphila sp. DG2A-62]